MPEVMLIHIDGLEVPTRNLMPIEIEGDMIHFHGIGEPSVGDFWNVYGRVRVGEPLALGDWMMADRVPADVVEEVFA